MMPSYKPPFTAFGNDQVQAIYDNWEQKVREDGIEEGRKDGLKEGEKRGLEEGRKEGIRALCGAFGIELNEDRERQLDGADLDQLEQLMTEVQTHRRWPAS